MAAPIRRSDDTKPADASDIRGDAPILRLLPGPARPYARLARLDRPIGTWLLLWPGWWAIALAADAGPAALWLIVAFGIGAVAMRGAGCCWNDIVDRDIDGRVARTASRPIPSGEIGVAGASVFMACLVAIGLAILLTFNGFAILVGIAAAAPVLLYPFMKRVTWWPQFFLGLAFNWGALLGWAAVTGGLGAPAALLYLGGIFWTLGYDTIYAHQDKEDDALIGVRSSARRLGRRTRPALALFYAAALACFAAAGLSHGLGAVFVAALIVPAAQLAWQVWRLDADDPADCLAKFRSNNGFGALFAAAIVAARVL